MFQMKNNLYVLLNFWLCVLFLVLKIVRDNPVVRFAARFKLLSFVYCWDTYFTFFSQWDCETTNRAESVLGLLYTTEHDEATNYTDFLEFLAH